MKRKPPAWLAGVLVLVLSCLSSAQAQEPRRVTILYDAFGAPSTLQKDWGFAALIEYGGKRILFDTGNDRRIFAHNVGQLRVDLTRLDAVVLSHRHGDHTSGLSHLLGVNSRPTIYVPPEPGFFKGPLPPGFLNKQPGLPTNLQYFEGREPERWATGTPWENGNFEPVVKTTEIFPGFFLFVTRSEKPGTLEMNELALAIRTPSGLAVVAGCSHPGVEKVLAEAARIDARLYNVTGGFHLVLTPEPEVQRVVSLLHDDLKVQRVAPGHCTSELGLAVFRDRFKERFDATGVGAVISLP